MWKILLTRCMTAALPRLLKLAMWAMLSTCWCFLSWLELWSTWPAKSSGSKISGSWFSPSLRSRSACSRASFFMVLQACGARLPSLSWPLSPYQLHCSYQAFLLSSATNAKLTWHFARCTRFLSILHRLSHHSQSSRYRSSTPNYFGWLLGFSCWRGPVF